MFMKNYCGSVVKAETGFFPPAMPIPGPIKMEQAYIPSHQLIHQPQPLQPLQFPFMMPRPLIPMAYPSVPPPLTPVVPVPVKVEPFERPMFESHSELPVLDLSVKKRRDSTVSNVSVISEPDNSNCDESEHGLDLTCPDKQNGGKTFKKALLNRYSKY